VATICNHDAGQVSYRISPLYVLKLDIAQAIIKGLVYLLAKKSFIHIELNTLSTGHEAFISFLNTIGFVNAGKNYVVCSNPSWIHPDIKVLKHVFCSIPLEYPHEAIAGIFN
jgi:hypothetical protein